MAEQSLVVNFGGNAENSTSREDSSNERYNVILGRLANIRSNRW